MIKHWFFSVVFIAAFFASKAQVNRYMVFFLDKDTVAWDVSSPEVFLSQKAVDRRAKQSIEVTAQDFPVNEYYVDSLIKVGVEVYHKSKWFNAVLIQGEENLIPNIQGISFVTKVEYIAPGALLQREQQSPIIPETFKEPPSVRATSSVQIKMLRADKMHADGYKGEGMTIAVMDNGFRGVNEYIPFQHLFDSNRVVATKDFIQNTGNVYQFGSHGTQVLSTISARYEDDMIGTAPKANVVLCVTEADGEYRVEEYNWLFAMEYVDSLGVDVVNSSLGYNTFDDKSMDYSLSDLDGNTAVITRAATIGASKGMVIVSSAGNTGSTNAWHEVTFPGDAQDILTVGSVNDKFERSSFSSYGKTADGRDKPDVCALGGPTTVVNGSGSIITSSGTSFASPLIAGFVASVWQAFPEWDYLRVIEEVKKSGRNSGTPDSFVGYGVPSYLSIINPNGLSLQQLLKPELKVFPNPFSGNSFTIDFQGTMLNENVVIELIDTKGSRIYRKKVNSRNRPDSLLVEFDSTEKGVYLLILTTGKQTKTIKLVKI